MATVNFYPRTKKGNSKIQARIKIGRDIDIRISTLVTIPEVEKNWDWKTNMPRNAKAKNFLENVQTQLLAHISDVQFELSKSVSDITSEDFRKIIYKLNRVPEEKQTFRRAKTETLADYIDVCINKWRKNGYKIKGTPKDYTESTFRVYESLKLAIDKYQQEEKITLYPDSFNRERFESFRLFLMNNYAVSTAGRAITALKTVLLHLKGIDNNKLRVHEFINSPDFKGHGYEPSIVPLSEAEQELIFATEMPTKELEWARDWLLVLCGTGQRFVDCNALTKANIKNGAIHVTQRKTGAKVEIPIFDRVQRIIDKYDGFPPRYHKKERSQGAYLNLKVKEVCKICGINETMTEVKYGKSGTYPKYKLVSTKTGRKSLATYLYMELLWDAQSCMAITGHRDLKSFFVYVGGERSAIAEKNRERVAKINAETVASRTKRLKKAQ